MFKDCKNDNMEKKLIEIGNYFKDKLITGEYKVIKWGDVTCTIIIDNKFEFDIWVFMGEENIKFYGLGESSIISRYYLLTLDEALEAWRNFIIHKNNFKYEIKNQKIKEFNEKVSKLRKELTEELKNIDNA